MPQPPSEPRRPSAGPWRSHDTEEGEWVVDIPDDGEITVARLYFGDMETNTGRDISNADLVAAAPDLLEACMRARSWLYGEAPSGLAVLDTLERAIAKATEGERP